MLNALPNTLKFPVMETSPEIVPPDVLNFKFAAAKAPLAKLAAEFAVINAALANDEPELAASKAPLAKMAPELAASNALLACVLTQVSVELVFACEKAALACAYAKLAVLAAYGSKAPPPVMVVISTLAPLSNALSKVTTLPVTVYVLLN